MTEADARSLCSRWLPAWTGNQPEKLLAFYAQDAVYRDPACPDGLRGHAQLRPYFTKLLAANPAWAWTATEVIPTDKGFTLKWRAIVPIAGNVVQSDGLDIVEVNDDGLITRNEVYFDTGPWKKAGAGGKGQRPGPGLAKEMITVVKDDDEHLRGFEEHMRED